MPFRRLIFAVALALAAFFTPATARGDVIAITAGSLSWSTGTAGVLSIQGTKGFTLDASASPSGGLFTPWQQCFGTADCAPGTPISLHSFWSGNDLPGTATYQGKTYTGVGGMAGSAPQANAQFTGTAIAPSYTGGVTSVTAPFAFTGMFAYPTGPAGLLTSVPLAGSGTAWLQLSPIGAGSPTGGYLLTGLRFDFAQAEPVPEPASLLLLGGGLAGLVARHRRRRA